MFLNFFIIIIIYSIETIRSNDNLQESKVIFVVVILKLVKLANY
jgi:hypothetical protein